jgi:DNA-binding transcriptional regulator GbsR (MarR family)
MQIKLTDTKLQLVEELGVMYERSMQPAAARILALLMVSDSIELTFEEIYETLNISKSAASNSLNFLLSIGRIEYITRPGERKRYFRCKLQGLKDTIQKSLLDLSALSSLFKTVLAQRPPETKEFNANLEEITQFLDFMRLELPVLFQKWEARKQ